MSSPTKNDILLGIAFVVFGTMYGLGDRWLVMTKVDGRGGIHVFDHLYLLWFLKQLFQLLLLLLSLAIEGNWCGCGRLKHGYLISRGYPHETDFKIPEFQDNHALLGNNNDDDDDDDVLMLNNNRHREQQSRETQLKIPEFQDRRALVVNNDEDDDVLMLDNNRHREQHSDEQLLNREDDEDNNINDDDEDTQASDEVVLLQNDDDKEVKVRKMARPSKIIYLLPALFELGHVLLLYFGMKLTYSSSFIMLKGTVAFFTALLSIAFLAHQLVCYVWCGVIVATLGFAVSGISDYINTPYGGYEKYGIAAGDLLIVMAQILFAAKIIYEERFIRKNSIHPMTFLGCEAIWGTFLAFIILLVLNFVDAEQYTNLPTGKMEDVQDALLQFSRSWRVIVAVIVSLLTYTLYTYLGLFLVRDQGALPRIMIETLIWLIYWSVCLALQWEYFFIAQVPGLCIIAIGSLIYSHILVLPFCSRLEGVDKSHGGFADQFKIFEKEDRPLPNERQEHEETGEEPDGRDGNLVAENENQGNEIVVEIHPNKNENLEEDLHISNSIDATQIQD